MAANFPNSPSINDTFTSNGVTFIWNGEAWKQPASPGVKGTKGDTGTKGEKGQKGDNGDKGQKGEIGLSGNPGGAGDKGQKGDTGAGDKGQKGDTGSDGDDGNKGDKGQKGTDGNDGTGIKGNKGEPGDKGQKGEGVKGQKGQDGNDGSGTKGNKGEPGADGSDGTSVKGQKGESVKGDKGQKGIDGDDGSSVKGNKGEPGASVKGEPGASVKGDKGQKGTDGDDGTSVKGQKGEVGTATKGQKGDDNSTKGDKGQKGEQGASGSATISNNADNRVITGGTGSNLNAEQNLTFDGSTLEVTGTGTPTIESASNLNITANTTTFSGNILPNTDSSHNIGSNGVRFANGYFDTLYGDGSNLTGISGGGGGTTINNNADNRVITGSNSANTLEAESSLTFNGTTLTAPSLTVNDYIYHAGNTNTFIGFESDNTIRFNTNGSDKLKINLSGHVILADDNNTYIHHPANDTIAVTAGGSEKLRIDTSGVVGNPDLRVVGSVSIGAGHPASNFYSGADDLVVANFAQDTGISIMSGTSNDATIAFGSTTFGTGAIQARLFYENDNDDFIMQTITDNHDIKLQSAGKIELGSSNDVIMTIEDPDLAASHGVEVSGTIYPKAPVGNLGLSGVRWNNIYGNYLHGDGSNITNVTGGVPSGTIVMYNGDSAPSGWVICDNSTAAQNAGAPDLRDKFIVSTGSSYNRGDTGGDASVTLTVNQIPSHDHNVDVLAEFASTHGTWQTAGGYRQVHTGGTHRKPITSDTGGGQSHENRPPYYAITFIMKT